MDYTAASVHDFYVFLLIFARVGGLITTAPLLGNRAIPRSALAGFIMVLSLTLMPLVAGKTGPIPDQLLLLAFSVLKNALFGLALGYLSRLLFSAVEMAGYFIDTQMGFGFINLVDPFSEHQSSVLSAFYYQLAVTIYMLLNGHLLLIGSLAQSFSVLPPDSISAHAGFGLTVVPMLKLMFILGLKLALPALGVLLIVDMAFGMVVRMVPQVNVFIVGMPAKIIMGLATVTVLLPVMATVVGQLITGTDHGLSALIAGAR